MINMKKLLAFSFILLIGLMILNGCTSTTNEPSGNQQTQQNANTQPQQNQQQAGSDGIPQPPALPEE